MFQYSGIVFVVSLFMLAWFVDYQATKRERIAIKHAKKLAQQAFSTLNRICLIFEQGKPKARTARRIHKRALTRYQRRMFTYRQLTARKEGYTK